MLSPLASLDPLQAAQIVDGPGAGRRRLGAFHDEVLAEEALMLVMRVKAQRRQHRR
jgi:hypothetical protein